MSDGAVRGVPRAILRAEGATILAAALLAYAGTGQPWWLFLALILAPDLSMLGYAGGPALGAALYNAAHTLTPALILLCVAEAFGATLAVGLALIWLAHIGLDRMLGYGLKYETGFGDTHLGAIGRARATANTPR
ncbi:MAG: DUF4260 domain-containing protein [Actinomycetospora chiangmaiensis]|nr:DUF4260 domain-containing protein [Actinomycetospora chiangmaiensis]